MKQDRMIDKYLAYLNEAERKEVLTYKLKNKYMWLYHGTIKKNESVIKRQGLKREHMKDYTGYPEFKPKGKYYNAKVLWVTSYYKFAKSFSIGMSIKAELFKKHRGPVLLVKVESKYLDYLNPKKLEQKLFDEYLYLKDIPIRDIIFPDDSRYKIIEKKMTYLKN